MEEEPTSPPALLQPRKRIAALSVVGDAVWRISLPVLEWMIENGDEELKDKAYLTMAHWDINQGWFIEWGNQTRYFEMAERACHDLASYKQAMKTIPADNGQVARIRELALMTGEILNRPIGIKSSRRKQRRGKRR